MGFGRVTVSRETLARDFRRAGIAAGDVLIVHSAMSRLGHVHGGPHDVVRALQDALGAEGTLLMPTFSFNLAGWNLPHFDPRNTPSRVGLLTDTFWRMDGVIRTPHPTHSVSAWGAWAKVLTDGPLSYEPLGLGSPLDRARLLDAKILLLGVGQVANSTVHVAESLARAPYLAVPFALQDDWDEASYMDPATRKITRLVINEMPGGSEGFAVLEEPLERMAIARPVKIGPAPSLLMRSQQVCMAVVEFLRQDPLYLLGGPGPSEITRRRRAHVEKLLRERAPARSVAS
ncbi:AAC(3)-VI family aminoglycoside N-acetyltransferase [soil metagenome]